MEVKVFDNAKKDAGEFYNFSRMRCLFWASALFNCYCKANVFIGLFSHRVKAV